jgi:hypothetical protein
MEIHTQLFNKLDYSNNRDGSKDINLRICAPDIYTEENIFKVSNFDINITYDNEFLNIYINNKLISYTRIINTNFETIYFTSNNSCKWNNILWWKHNKLLNIPLWKTKNIDNFEGNKPGIKFTSKINSSSSFDCTIKQKTPGYFYILDKDRKYLSVVYTESSSMMYETKWLSTKPTNDDNCLWKLYDTNVNIPNYVNVLEYKDAIENDFICSEANLSNITNTDKTHWSNFDNSTNLMLKAKINKSTKQVDEMSDYFYHYLHQ